MDKRKSSGKGGGKERIIDLNDYRKNKNEERRREYERVLFNRVLGVYSFAETQGLHHVEILDISYSGLRFKEKNPEHPIKPGQKVALRFYFTPNSYLRLVVDVKRVSPYEEEGGNAGLEYGCEIDKQTKSFEVMNQLVSFMYKYAEVACEDQNPPLIWF